MLLTQKEVVDQYKISRPTLLKWEKLEDFQKVVIRFPGSDYRRYVKDRLDVFLGITEGDVAE